MKEKIKNIIIKCRTKDSLDKQFTIYAGSFGDPSVGIPGLDLELKTNCYEDFFDTKEEMDAFRKDFNKFLGEWFDDKFDSNSNYECPDCHRKLDSDGTCNYRSCISFIECHDCKVRTDLVWNNERECLLCKKCNIIERL